MKLSPLNKVQLRPPELPSGAAPRWAPALGPYLKKTSLVACHKYLDSNQATNAIVP